ncbi:hypothetical protein [Synechocystis sp. LKSZ1]|uniref:hypothetical protein n=1 Tax=Synechocystis sp. LKSZ1 TaxID=3144951 RepID=UPI00336BBE61
MSRPSAHLVSQSAYLVRGQITIHETAVIAPGTILQADPGYQVVIGAGVCIGRGSIIHAWGGPIILAPGAIIGPRCLVMGQVEVGQDACLGAEVTLWNTAVAERALIPPKSLLGDPSRPQQEIPPLLEETVSIPSPWDSEAEHPVSPPEATPESLASEDVIVELSPPATEEAPLAEREELKPERSPEKPPVVGQVYINQLLVTLFPERNLFKKNT